MRSSSWMPPAASAHGSSSPGSRSSRCEVLRRSPTRGQWSTSSVIVEDKSSCGHLVSPLKQTRRSACASPARPGGAQASAERAAALPHALPPDGGRARRDRGLFRRHGLAPDAGLDRGRSLATPALLPADRTAPRDSLDLDDCAVDGSHVRALKGDHVGPRPSTAPAPAPSTTCSSTATEPRSPSRSPAATVTMSPNCRRFWMPFRRSGACADTLAASPCACTPTAATTSTSTAVYCGATSSR